MSRELRTAALTATVERRAASTDEGGDPAELRFTGHAAVFDQPAWIGPKRWGFWEIIARNAFDDVLESNAAFLVNHDPNILLARNGVTMSLTTDDTGLVPDAQWDPTDPDAVMWAGRVRRGDITQMSFAFEVGDEQWTEGEDGMETRTILKFSELYDVSIVTYPAYEGTDAEMNASAAEIVKRHRGFDPRTTDPRPAKRSGSVLSSDQQRHRHVANAHGLSRA